MKKLLVVLVCTLLLSTPMSVYAIDNWKTANQATVAWEPNPANIAFAGERFINVIYLVNYQTDPGKTNPVEVGRTNQNQLTFTIGVKGQYVVGAKVVLEIEDQPDVWLPVNESAMIWSDDPAVCENGMTFGFRFYPTPIEPTKLRPL